MAPRPVINAVDLHPCFCERFSCPDYQLHKCTFSLHVNRYRYRIDVENYCFIKFPPVEKLILRLLYRTLEWALKICVTDGQIQYERHHLLNKLKVRDQYYYKKMLESEIVLIHSLFELIENPIKDWEVQK